MDQYDYAQVKTYLRGGVYFWCTDTKQINKLMAQIKEIIPSAYFDLKSKLPIGEAYSFEIKGLGGKDWDVKWWIIKLMCQDSWEPIGVEAVPGRTDYDIHQFKRKTIS
ncbi:MAG: hypothetical protein M1511_01465 [Deltaproteobacteria bacterium]|nr:hypothetical protein [Deltaproteobacteria bacterium]